MEEQLILIMVTITNLLFIILFYHLTLMLTAFLLRKRKEKLAIELVNGKGYTTLTFDKNGIPHLLQKGTYIGSVFAIKKSLKLKEKQNVKKTV